MRALELGEKLADRPAFDRVLRLIPGEALQWASDPHECHGLILTSLDISYIGI